MNKIAFVTGSRADYGIMRRYLDLINKDNNIDLSILATGALLDSVYGHQVDLIYKDGFKVFAEITLTLDTSSNAAILKSMAEALEKFGSCFEENKFDLLIILGDRYEMLSVATAAAIQKIPILHIHGGEVTYGNYDEFIRHSITKMSLYHFTSTEKYRNRVIQMGEKPENVFCLGALGAENCLFIKESNVPENVINLPFQGYFVVLFHPETLTNNNVAVQIQELLEAITCFSNWKFVFLGTNADTHSDIIRKMVHNYIDTHSNTIYFENLHTDAYHYLLKNSAGLIGNSSSGLIEAPSLGILTINIGSRQKGRVHGNSVLDVKCNKSEIKSAINEIISKFQIILPENPYYQKNAAKKYYETTKKILYQIKSEEITEAKEFYDL